MKRITRTLEELGEYVRIFPTPAEFFDYQDKLSVLLELSDIADMYIPPSPRPKLGKTEDGTVVALDSLPGDPFFGTVSVFFVGGNIVCMYAETKDGKEQVRSAVPLDEIKWVFSLIMFFFSFYLIACLGLMSCSTQQEDKWVGQVDQPPESPNSTDLAPERVGRAYVVRLIQFRGRGK